MPSSARDAIQAAFLDLLEKRPLHEITVKDIVQSCGVNRNSFYYHFKDIPTLLQDILAQKADEIISQLAPARSLPDCLDAAARLAMDHRRLVLHIRQSGDREILDRHLMELCRRAVCSYAAAAFGEAPIRPDDREVLIRFFQCECFGQIAAWMDSGMRYDIQAQFRRLCQLGEGMTELLLRRAAAEAAGDLAVCP